MNEKPIEIDEELKKTIISRVFGDNYSYNSLEMYDKYCGYFGFMTIQITFGYRFVEVMRINNPTKSKKNPFINELINCILQTKDEIWEDVERTSYDDTKDISIQKSFKCVDLQFYPKKNAV